MSILNDVEKIRSTDPGNMYNAIFDMPEHMYEAVKIAQNWEINKDDFIDIKNIVVIGMGGSAIGGDLVRSYLSSKLLIPFNVVRHYTLPEYVDDETLVIASSYSGNTEETLAALDDAISRKAMIAAISTGGMMQDVCKFNEIPIAILPEGLQPRAALGYSFIPLLLFLEKIGLVKDAEAEAKALIDFLQKSRESFIEDVPDDKNQAKQLAEKIQGKIPIIYSGPTLTDTVGIRWKGQLCENSKNMAFANQFAEFNHNELVGWHELIDPYKDKLIVIQLRDKDDHAGITKRMNIVQSIIEELGVEVVNIKAKGNSELERIFSLIQYGDFVSYYLAVLNGVDPSPVEVIQKLKKMLSDNK